MEIGSRKKTVLLIEDEPIICRVCVKTLTASGLEVDVASNGLVAADKAGKTAYDLYISDIRTPAMNGMEFYHHLKESQPEAANRVIFTTGDVLNREVKAFLQENGRFFLAKPFTPDDLRKVVGRAIAEGSTDTAFAGTTDKAGS
jgi:CheY-like chemotaxis protein